MMSLIELVIRNGMKTGSTEVCPRHILVVSAAEQSPICDEHSQDHPFGSPEDAPPPLDAQGHPYGGPGHPWEDPGHPWGGDIGPEAIPLQDRQHAVVPLNT